MLQARAIAPAPVGSGLRSVRGNSGLPLLGDTLRLLYDPRGLWSQRYARYGPVSWTSLLGIKAVLVLGPDAAGEVLQNRTKAFGNGAGWEYFIGPFFRRGIMLLDFEEHLRHRHLMQQAFVSSRLSQYLVTMSPAIERQVSEWPNDREFAIYPALKQLTLDLATDTFMGGGLGPEADQVNRAFVDCVAAGNSLIRFPVPGLRWSRGLAGRRVLERVLSAQLPEKRAHAGDDLFSALCHAVGDDGERFSDEDVVNHMIFLLMAAHDTSTIAMTTMTYYLAKHPEWQERCREESLALGKTTLDFDDLNSLRSLDLVMKEALRLAVPLPQMPRRAVADTEVQGHHIPKGSLVLLVPEFVHYMPEYWPDPEKFDPERFADHRREDKVHRHAWIPFGGGVHKCIGMYFAGMEIKAVMHQMLLQSTWTVAPDYELPWDRTSLPRPKDGLPIRMRRRCVQAPTRTLLLESRLDMAQQATSPVVAITGGAQGIGRAIALRLADAGMRVAIGDIDLQRTKETAEQLAERGTVGYWVDVADADSFESFIAAVEAQLGPVDILINNAGIMPIGPFLDGSVDLSRRAMDINVLGPLNGMRAALPGMLARGAGHIVNIASTAGKVATPGTVVYSATKHAVVGMSDAVRQEFGASGINVTTVLPSFTNTEMIAGTSGVRGIRNNEPSEVAEAVLRGIQRKQNTVYVPGFARGTTLLHDIMPARFNDALARLFRADRVFLDFDQNQRASYQGRIAGNVESSDGGSHDTSHSR